MRWWGTVGGVFPGGISQVLCCMGWVLSGSISYKRLSMRRAMYVDEHLYNIQCSEIFTLRNEKLHTET
jgi:hypothetical protein